jgi:hypothetical protein
MRASRSATSDSSFSTREERAVGIENAVSKKQNRDIKLRTIEKLKTHTTSNIFAPSMEAMVFCGVLMDKLRQDKPLASFFDFDFWNNFFLPPVQSARQRSCSLQGQPVKACSLVLFCVGIWGVAIIAPLTRVRNHSHSHSHTGSCL